MTLISKRIVKIRLIKFWNVVETLIKSKKNTLYSKWLYRIRKNVFYSFSCLIHNRTLSIKKSSFFLIKKFFPDRNISRKNSKISIFIAFSITVFHFAHTFMKRWNCKINRAHFNVATMNQKWVVLSMLFVLKILRFSNRQVSESKFWRFSEFFVKFDVFINT